jgi:secreted trypsin-like serine protease
MRAVRSVVVLLLVLALSAVFATPAFGVIGGTKDVGNTFNNVGMIAFQLSDGSWMHGTCTLVAPGVVLTAAHCVNEALASGDVSTYKVSFYVAPTPETPAGQTWYEVDHFVVHPGYDNGSMAGILSDSKLYLRREDVALVWLKSSPDLPLSKIADVGAFDGLNLKTARFTVAGYGTIGYDKGSLMSWQNKNTQMNFDGRNVADVRVINDSEVFAERYVKTSSATSFGDSGGPMFYGSALVAETVWGESARACSPGYEYRLDTPTAHDFLDDWLSEDCFVSVQ